MSWCLHANPRHRYVFRHALDGAKKIINIHILRLVLEIPTSSACSGGWPTHGPPHHPCQGEYRLPHVVALPPTPNPPYQMSPPSNPCNFMSEPSESARKVKPGNNTLTALLRYIISNPQPLPREWYCGREDHYCPNPMLREARWPLGRAHRRRTTIIRLRRQRTTISWPKRPRQIRGNQRPRRPNHVH